ncbi:hypothetical protein OnM2_101027 [Erysiphe neolycopersici]|uniref:Uncharacterized protein n=1 Tax=Erysiphe neolycopersici TaxID=212602 RepID=A0A420H8S8_9PEZI|nr:hypothetical protein OnM2_101027 [Erysiphe neolycopersici]
MERKTASKEGSSDRTATICRVTVDVSRKSPKELAASQPKSLNLAPAPKRHQPGPLPSRRDSRRTSSSRQARARASQHRVPKALLKTRGVSPPTHAAQIPRHILLLELGLRSRRSSRQVS